MKKLLSLIIVIMLFQYSTDARQKSNSIKAALLIIDIQNFYFPGGSHELVNAELASLAAKEVLQIFRDKKQLVVHVRHKSSSGFEINNNVKPLPDEKVITKEEVNAFLHTDLLEYLKKHKINRLVIIGMQTQMCVEGAVRAAHDFGFDCFVVKDACATRDLKFEDRTAKSEDVQIAVFATFTSGGYAKVIDLKALKENPDKFLFQ